jgi:hypothetical protein
MVQRTHYDGNICHLTGIVHCTLDEYAAMPTRASNDNSGCPIA